MDEGNGRITDNARPRNGRALITNVDLDLRTIQAYDGDRRKGFEELVCQLARREYTRTLGMFRRVEGSGGDAGVEGYWLLQTGQNMAIRPCISLLSRKLPGPKSTNP